MLRVKAVTQSRHTGGDLVELDTLLASVCTICTLVQALKRSYMAEGGGQEGRHTALEDEHGCGKLCFVVFPIDPLNQNKEMKRRRRVRGITKRYWGGRRVVV